MASAMISISVVSLCCYTSAAYSAFLCPRATGYFRDAADCSVFYRCASHRPYRFFCQNGLLFSTAYNTCTWPNQVPGCRQRHSPSTGRPTVPSNIVMDDAILNIPGFYLNNQTQCALLQLALNALLQNFIQSNSLVACPAEICPVPAIIVRCSL